MIAVLGEGRGGVSLDGLPRPWFGRSCVPGPAYVACRAFVLGGVAALRPVTVQAFAVPTGVSRVEPALPGRIRWERIGQRLG